MKKNNVWFLVAGILSILEAVSMFFLTLVFAIFLIMFNSTAFDSTSGSQLTPADLAVLNATFTTCIIIFLIMFAVSIFNSVVYLKNMSKTQNELQKSSGLIMTTIVLSFIGGGVIIGVFGILGYMLKENIPSAATTVSVENDKEENDSPAKKQLEQLKDLKDSGIITDEEFEKKRKEIINNL